MSVMHRLVRLAYPYGSVRRIWRGPLAGGRYVVWPGMGATYALGRGMFLDVVRERVKLGMTVYDVGANAGQLALGFSRWVGPNGKVVSFEPAPAPFRMLERTVRVAPYPNIQAMPLALSDMDGTTTMLFSPDDPTRGKLDGVEPTERAIGWPVVVHTRRLDTVIAEGGPLPDFMKIDVEGAAARVFRGGMETLRRSRPVIYIEFHGPEEWAAGRDFIRELDYDCHQTDGTPVPDPTQPHKALPFWLTPR